MQRLNISIGADDRQKYSAEDPSQYGHVVNAPEAPKTVHDYEYDRVLDVKGPGARAEYGRVVDADIPTTAGAEYGRVVDVEEPITLSSILLEQTGPSTGLYGFAPDKGDGDMDLNPVYSLAPLTSPHQDDDDSRLPTWSEDSLMTRTGTLLEPTKGVRTHRMYVPEGAPLTAESSM